MKSKKQVYALTGGIASGKSTVAKELKKKGFHIIDADKIAHEIYRSDKKLKNQIVKNFGKEILNKKNEIDRKKLGQLIFTNPVLKQKLETLTHPAIFRKIEEEIKKSKKRIFVEAALLFETGYNKRFEKTLLVACPQKRQVERLMQRDQISKQEALQKIKSQMPLKEKIKKADFVIWNKGSLEELKEKVNKLEPFLKEKVWPATIYSNSTFTEYFYTR